MGWQLTPLVVVHVAIAVVLCIIGVITSRHRDVTGARTLTALTFTIAVWVAATAGYLARTDVGGKRIFLNLSFFGITVVPVLYLFFAAEYGSTDLRLTRYGPVPLVVVPAITQVLVWTNRAHGLMWSTRTLDPLAGTVTIQTVPGSWFWVHSGYSYALVAVATVVLVRTVAVSGDVYRWQAVAILAGVVSPGIANVAYITGLVDLWFDPTPVAFAVTAVAFLAAIFRHRILEVVPAAREVARDQLMDELVEAVFILDDRGHVVDCNPRAEALVPGTEERIVGRPLGALIPDLAAVAVPEEGNARPDGGDERAEIRLRRDGERRYYDVRTRRLRRGGGLLTGTLVSLRDVTERRQREQRLNVLNRTLRHDLRNEATVIVGYADLGRKDNPEAAWLDALVEHVDDLVEMGRKVRELEQALDGETGGSRPVDVADVVRRSVAELEAERTVDVEVDLPDSAWAVAIDDIGWAIENALENAVVHNDSLEAHLEVSVSSDEGDDVVVEIADDGPGIDPAERAVLEAGEETQLEHGSGLGLWTIHWLVTESGGAVEFAENDPQGSVVTLRLPGASPPAEETAPRTESADTDE